jgi:hypothetical protein
MSEAQSNVIPLQKEILDQKQVKLWRSRCKTANKFHRSQIMERYERAKARYNCEAFGYQKLKGKYTHENYNFLFKAIEEFNASIYMKNPQIDLISRDTKNKSSIHNIETLEQFINDDIRDDRILKPTIRAGLIDEALSGISGFYIDYCYKTENGTNEVAVDENGKPIMQQVELENKVKLTKILPENIIRPPFQTLFNYSESPYLGYIDIVSLEMLKRDETLDQSQVAKLKGKSYDSLLDVDQKDLKREGVNLNDDLLYEKVFYVWIRGNSSGPLKRLVLSEDDSIDAPLDYSIFDRGHGPDDRGYPIHFLALNDPSHGFLPPSEAWILESSQNLLEYLMHKFTVHIKKSKTKTLVKGGQEGIKKDDMVKILGTDDLEFISINGLPPSIDLRSLVYQLQDQPLSVDHVSLFELAKRIFDELSRKPDFAQVTVQERKKTATETAAIQQNDVSSGSYKVDKFKEFLIGVFYDWAKLKQRNFIGQKSIFVKNKMTGTEEQREILGVKGNAPQLQGEFNADINLETFLMPNKELKRRIMKETLSDLSLMNPILSRQKKQLNGVRIVEEYVQNIDARNPEEFVIDAPIRNVDQQVLDLVSHGQPMNPMEVGDDLQSSLQRTMQIFSDHDLMLKLEHLVPEISTQGSPIAKFAMDLEKMTKSNQASHRPQEKNTGSDMRVMAGQMASAQR